MIFDAALGTLLLDLSTKLPVDNGLGMVDLVKVFFLALLVVFGGRMVIGRNSLEKDIKKKKEERGSRFRRKFDR